MTQAFTHLHTFFVSYFTLMQLWLVSKKENTVSIFTLSVTAWYLKLLAQQKASTVKHSGPNVVNTALMYNAAGFPLTAGDGETWGGVCVWLREKERGREGDKEINKLCGWEAGHLSPKSNNKGEAFTTRNSRNSCILCIFLSTSYCSRMPTNANI